MTTPVAHINLLQRTAPAHTTAWGLAALLALTVIGMLYYGSQVRSLAQEAVHRARRRGAAAQAVAGAHERADRRAGQECRRAVRAARDRRAAAAGQAAQALIDAVGIEAGRTEEFARALAAMTGVNEPGLWLTSLTVGAGGKKLELKGEARSGALVLRFARRANESLRPLTMRLDSLEMQPARPRRRRRQASARCRFVCTERRSCKPDSSSCSTGSKPCRCANG
jgi:hypothetical protein